MNVSNDHLGFGDEIKVNEDDGKVPKQKLACMAIMIAYYDCSSRCMPSSAPALVLQNRDNNNVKK